MAGQTRHPALPSLGNASGRFSSVSRVRGRLPSPAADGLPRRRPLGGHHERSVCRLRQGLELGDGYPDGFPVTPNHAVPEPGLTCFAHDGTGGMMRDKRFAIMAGRQRRRPAAGPGAGASRTGGSEVRQAAPRAGAPPRRRHGASESLRATFKSLRSAAHFRRISVPWLGPHFVRNCQVEFEVGGFQR